MSVLEEMADLRSQSEWLVANRREMEQGESGWLLALARFDAAGGWAEDGQASCVDWLRWRTGMARSTAYEKIRLALELQRHELVAEAFSNGRVSYSAARLICRLHDLEPATEAALVTLAEHATIRDLEAATERYRQLEDQERPPADPDLHRTVRVCPDIDGWIKVEHRMPAIEGGEFIACLDAFMAFLRREHEAGTPGGSARAEDGADGPENNRQSACADDGTAASGEIPAPAADRPSARAEDSADAEAAAEAEDESVADTDESARAEDGAIAWHCSRALAFREMVRCAMAHVGGGRAMGDDRYLVHVVARDGQLTLLDGTPIDPATAGEILCDAATVAHTVDEHGEALSLGRKTRTWSTSQRRAVLVRDGGRCRFPGCERRVRDIHHRQPWEEGGSTDVVNGMAACRRHHTLLHHGGFQVHGDAAGSLVFLRPDGSALGATVPAQQRLVAA